MILKKEWAERFIRACAKVEINASSVAGREESIYVRLSHQDRSELVGAARPVISAELVQMKREGLLEFTRCFFCVDDLAGLHCVATE
jgi:hypothetical protein